MMPKFKPIQRLILILLLSMHPLALGMGGGGGDGTVGDVFITSITVNSTNGDGTRNLSLAWNRQNGSGSNGHLKSWMLTVSDGSTTQYSCEDSHVHNDTNGNDVGKTAHG